MIRQTPERESKTALSNGKPGKTVIVCGEGLTLEDIWRVARHQAPVKLCDEPEVLARLEASVNFVMQAARDGKPMYGITTGFGGMANTIISSEDAAELQQNLIWYHKCGTGKFLPVQDVRAAMLLRANSLMQGRSGIRFEILQRIETFLNAGVTPHIREFGSIGASGDLVPLTAMTGSLIGLDASFTVDVGGETVDCLTALKQLGLPRLSLQPKEGLALINGTAVMTGIAANALYEARILLALSLGAHALMIQALLGSNQSFHPFIHTIKPHPGQLWSAAQMLSLLAGSKFIQDELDGRNFYKGHDLIQDRYSLRCLPQYFGPLVDGLGQIKSYVEIEANSVSDNPLIDAENGAIYRGGNFLGQYIGIGMDHLRYYLGLLAKHLDAQIALLVAPEFNYGLSASLVGNPDRKVNMGLKGLQLVGNSIMPVLTFLGNSLADRFPTHAEQFNQNINSQGFGSANLARQSVEIFRQYVSLALLFGVQAVDLRTYALAGHYDARACLSPATASLYEAVRAAVGVPPSAERPYVWDDDEQTLDLHLEALEADLAAEGEVPASVRALVERLP